jgi:hypothetical protein
MMGQTSLQLLSIALVGCLAGFMFFNKTPAKIFLGDSGSLTVGMMIAVFSIRFLNLNEPSDTSNNSIFFPQSAAIVFSLLLVPVFDTIRLFSLRLIRKKSPFTADRNHIHHLLLDLHLNHLQSSTILIFYTCCFLLLALLDLPVSLEVYIAGTGIISAFLVRRITKALNRNKRISIPLVKDEYAPVKPGLNIGWLSIPQGNISTGKNALRKNSENRKIAQIKK